MVTKKDKRKAATDAKLFLKEVNRITAKIAKMAGRRLDRRRR